MMTLTPRQYFYEREQRRLDRVEKERLAWLPRVRQAVIDCVPNFPEVRRVCLFGSILFRHVYTLKIDAARLKLVTEKAAALRKIYKDQMECFMDFLKTLRELGENKLPQGRVSVADPTGRQNACHTDKAGSTVEPASSRL
jgi:hypothetical protein